MVFCSVEGGEMWGTHVCGWGLICRWRGARLGVIRIPIRPGYRARSGPGLGVNSLRVGRRKQYFFPMSGGCVCLACSAQPRWDRQTSIDCPPAVGVPQRRCKHSSSTDSCASFHGCEYRQSLAAARVIANASPWAVGEDPAGDPSRMCFDPWRRAACCRFFFLRRYAGARAPS